MRSMTALSCIAAALAAAPVGAQTQSPGFKSDLAPCRALEPESQSSCRREMFAARVQGLYRN